jgi:hypothetical protein
MPEQFIGIIRRALMGEEEAWGELRDNASLTVFAGVVLVLVALLGGIGAWLWGEFMFDYTPDDWFVDTVILGTIFTIILLVAWAAVTYLLLTSVFGATVAPDAMLRIFAVALIPYALTILMFIPEVNFFIALGSLAIVFCLLKFGVQTAFSVSRMHAAQATLAGFAVFAILMALLITVDNRWVTGPFIFEATEDVQTKDYSSGNTADIDIPDLEDIFQTTPTGE